jgi:hypothetical protein
MRINGKQLKNRVIKEKESLLAAPER